MLPISFVSEDIIVATDKITLQIDVKNSGVYRFSISHSCGGHLLQQTFIQLDAGNQELDIPLPLLERGAYLLHIFNIQHKISYPFDIP